MATLYEKKWKMKLDKTKKKTALTKM